MKIGIITSCTTDTYDWSQISFWINRNYAIKWNYDFISNVHIRNSDFSPHWFKIYDVLDNLPNYDWLFWIDADAFFFDDSKDLKKIIDLDTSGVNLHICKDIPSEGEKWEDIKRINTGTFFIKNCDWSFKVFSHIIDNKGRHAHDNFHEQDVLYYHIKEMKEVKIHDFFKFNGVAPWHRTCDFITHLVGRNSDEKRWTMTEIGKNLTKEGFIIPEQVLKHK